MRSFVKIAQIGKHDVGKVDGHLCLLARAITHENGVALNLGDLERARDLYTLSHVLLENRRIERRHAIPIDEIDHWITQGYRPEGADYVVLTWELFEEQPDWDLPENSKTSTPPPQSSKTYPIRVPFNQHGDSDQTLAVILGKPPGSFINPKFRTLLDAVKQNGMSLTINGGGGYFEINR